MSREHSCSAIILKKQAFNDSDEIITVFSKEEGKLRLLAKSVKSPKSKLQHALQVLFLVSLRTAGGRMPKIIGADVQETFGNIRENLEASKRAFYALELCIKFTPDEQKNEQLFFLLSGFFEFLNSASSHPDLLDFALAKFKISILDVLGMGIQTPSELQNVKKIAFSSKLGGFVSLADSGLEESDKKTLDLFLALEQSSFENLGNLVSRQSLKDLQVLLSNFVEYQLEREVKSEKYLKFQM